MAQFINMVPVELMNGTAPVVSLRHVHQGDHNANRVGAIVTMDGEPYDLDGSCAGTAILADGSTVPLSGTISENEAYIDLDSACYQVEGHLHVFITWVDGNDETTLVEFVGEVQITATGRVIQPSVPVPSLPQLMAAIEEMRDATEAAEAAADKAVRYDADQDLTYSEKIQAIKNIQSALVGDTDANGDPSGMYFECW